MFAADTKRLMGRTWSFLRPYRTLVSLSLGCLGLAAPLAQVHPLIWKYAVDDVLLTKNAAGLGIALAVMIVSQVLATLFSTLQSYCLEKAGQGFVRDVRNAVFAHLEGQSLSYHHERRTGDLVARVISDVDAMETSVLGNLSDLLGELVTFVVVAGIVVWLQPVIGLCVMLPLVVSFFVVHRFGDQVKKIYEAVRARLGDVGAFVHDRLAGVQLAQGFAQVGREQREFENVTQAYYEQSVRALRVRNAFFPAVGILGFLSNVIMLGLGVWFIWRGEFTLGGLIAYRGYWWRLQSPISTLARMTDTLLRAKAAARRVIEVLDTQVEVIDLPGASPLGQGAGAIEFQDVRFQYSSGPSVLERITFRVAPGELVAIAGTSGAGKTTLLQLVPRFFDPSAGRILVDGQDLRNVTLDSLRAQIGMVSQETYLFNATIRENISYARPAATLAEIEEAAQRAQAHSFITELPRGYDTLVGERGVKLSGGQKQRLSIARAFLFGPRILILDEPTSSVEPETEALIQASLEELSGSRTTLVVSHRIAFLRKARRILFLRHGRVEADGDHAALRLTCPSYSAAYDFWEAAEREESAIV